MTEIQNMKRKATENFWMLVAPSTTTPAYNMQGQAFEGRQRRQAPIRVDDTLSKGAGDFNLQFTICDLLFMICAGRVIDPHRRGGGQRAGFWVRRSKSHK